MAKDKPNLSEGGLLSEQEVAKMKPELEKARQEFINSPNPLKPSLSDANARDSFIAAALREIVAWQLAEGKVNHDQAGALAVRYGNSTMAVRGLETAPLKVTVAKGSVVPVEAFTTTPPSTETKEMLEKLAPKTIAEIIGDAPELAEVK